MSEGAAGDGRENPRRPPSTPFCFDELGVVDEDLGNFATAPSSAPGPLHQHHPGFPGEEGEGSWGEEVWGTPDLTEGG